MKKIWFSDLKSLNLKKFEIKDFLFSNKYNYNKQLSIRGVGYKTWLEKDSLNFDLGLTHYISMKLPSFANVLAKKIKIIISSKNNKDLGIFSNNIKSLKYPDAYKGKGIRFFDESIKLKVGKVKN
jgi:large subunit ribosomal protein L6